MLPCLFLPSRSRLSAQYSFQCTTLFHHLSPIKTVQLYWNLMDLYCLPQQLYYHEFMCQYLTFLQNQKMSPQGLHFQIAKQVMSAELSIRQIYLDY